MCYSVFNENYWRQLPGHINRFSGSKRSSGLYWSNILPSSLSPGWSPSSRSPGHPPGPLPGGWTVSWGKKERVSYIAYRWQAEMGVIFSFLLAWGDFRCACSRWVKPCSTMCLPGMEELLPFPSQKETSHKDEALEKSEHLEIWREIVRRR